jgi:hypothetical protein
MRREINMSEKEQLDIQRMDETDDKYELITAGIDEIEFYDLPRYISDNTRIRKSRSYLAFFPNASLRCLKILDCIISHIKSDVMKKDVALRVKMPALEIATKMGLGNVESIYSMLPAFVKEYNDKNLGTMYIYDEDQNQYMSYKVMGTVAYAKGWLHVEILSPKLLFTGSYTKFDTLITTKFSGLTSYRLYTRLAQYRFIIFEKGKKEYKVVIPEEQLRCEVGTTDLTNPNVKKFINSYRGDRKQDEFFLKISEIAKTYDELVFQYKTEMEENKKSLSEVEEIDKIIPGWINNKEKAYKYPRTYDLKKVLVEAVKEINEFTELHVEMELSPPRKYVQQKFTFTISENPNWGHSLRLKQQDFEEKFDAASKMMEEVPTEKEEFHQMTIEDFFQQSSEDEQVSSAVEFIMKYCKDKIPEFNLSDENIKTIIKETKETEEHIIRGLEYAYNQPSKVENMITYSIKCIKNGYAFQTVPSKNGKNSFANFDQREVDWAEEERRFFNYLDPKEDE